jgi:hypothetical protein
VITKPERVRFIGKFVLVRVRDKLIPDVEAMLLQLPKLLLAEIRNWRAVNGLFLWSCRLSRAVYETRRGHVRNPAIGQMAHEGDHSATGQSGEVSLQIFLLLPAECDIRKNSFGTHFL